jgi:hypothetical protein
VDGRDVEGDLEGTEEDPGPKLTWQNGVLIGSSPLFLRHLPETQVHVVEKRSHCDLHLKSHVPAHWQPPPFRL